jgi:FKBP-type peptidyl-prolyl cis-trans isomerase
VVLNTFAANVNAFDVQTGKPALFMFCSEDGVISGWNQSVSGTKAGPETKIQILGG